jgi:hypothetical protein
MIWRAAIGTLVALSAITLISCSNKPNKTAPKAESPTSPPLQASAKQQPLPQPVIANSTAQIASREATAPPGLYLLAGTPADDYSYPVTLYRAQEGRLQVVRELLPQTEGARFIQAWGNVVFLTHPAQNPKAVTVLHADEPLRVDDLDIVPDDPKFSFVANEAIAEPRASVFDELMLASTGELSTSSIQWLSVSSDLSAPGPRVKKESWNEYAALRLEGEPGGPGDYAALFAWLSDTNLIFRAWDHLVMLDSLSPSVREAISQTAMQRVQIVAASRQYLLLSLLYSQEDLFSRKFLNAVEMDLFVHDRLGDNWKTIRVEGNRSQSRLFGPWLATIVRMFSPDGKPSPGRNNERGPEAFGDYEIAGSKGNDGNARFPLIRGQYSSSFFLPGVLVLQNLEDGRKIRIATNQEDSEIVNVSGDTVIYRVNDAVYQAKIAGDKLQGVMLLARGEDVPEIHWAFWFR